MKFTELDLRKEVLDGTEKAGFKECTMVQERVLPVSLSGKDVMVQSKTGSGKTAVFLLTIFQRYLATEGKSSALVVAPTRELAVQIEEDAKLLSSGIPGYRTGCFYGGVGYEAQNREIASGLSLYVGTPGRLLDYAKSHKIDFRQFDTVVLDEADRMFDMGFYPDIRAMFAMMRDKEKRQTMLFSATLSTKVRNLAWNYMDDPDEITVQPEEITVKKITQELFHVTRDEKFSLMLQLIKKYDPASCLIFTNTKDRAVEVAKRLGMNGYHAEYLMGDMAQGRRLETLDRMKDGRIRFLVATDVAARGLQIDDLELVVNYDIPEDYENYVHRIGRTARAGKSGKAVTLASEDYIYGLEAIESYIQMKIPVLWPDEIGLEEVEDRSEGYHYSSRRKDSANKGKTSSRPRGTDLRRQKDSFRSSREREVKDEDEYRSDTDFKALRGMSVEERMKYYASVYSDGARGGAQSGPKPRNASRPDNRKGQGGEKRNSAPGTGNGGGRPSSSSEGYRGGKSGNGGTHQRRNTNQAARTDASVKKENVPPRKECAPVKKESVPLASSLAKEDGKKSEVKRKGFFARIREKISGGRKA